MVWKTNKRYLFLAQISRSNYEFLQKYTLFLWPQELDRRPAEFPSLSKSKVAKLICTISLPWRLWRYKQASQSWWDLFRFVQANKLSHWDTNTQIFQKVTEQYPTRSPPVGALEYLVFDEVNSKGNEGMTDLTGLVMATLSMTWSAVTMPSVAGDTNPYSRSRIWNEEIVNIV